MKRLIAIVALLGLTWLGLNLSAQQAKSAKDQAGAQQQPTDTQSQPQSPRALEGKIAKSGSQFVFQEASTQTAYKLDDQDKVKPFEGKNVKVMATVDPNTNTLHIVDIAPSESR